MGKASARQVGLAAAVIPRRFPSRWRLGRMPPARCAHHQLDFRIGRDRTI